MQKRAFGFLAGAALLAGGIALAHPGHPPLPTPVVKVSAAEQAVPFELFRGNRIVVPARINGHETHVILDTGASLSTLNLNYARSIGLPAGFKIQAKGAGGNVDAELISGLTMDLGGYHAENASVAAMDLAPIERSIGMPISAIFGRDFFNSAVISIDWANSKLKIRIELPSKIIWCITITSQKSSLARSYSAARSNGPEPRLNGARTNCRASRRMVSALATCISTRPNVRCHKLIFWNGPSADSGKQVRKVS